ncbi:MAG TPA: N-acyl homoserine lactonase family protein [Pseudolabrys sp.]|nr:N-acyl homoserine lactonase family protein [Pseudolabrys sp.]
MKLAYVLAAAALLLSPHAAFAKAKSGVDRLTILDCGQGRAADMSRWTPGENVNVPMDVVDNCYLIHHKTKGYLLWDTGVTDAIFGKPEGPPPASGAPNWRKPKSLAGQLEQLGVKPSDIKYVAVSHTHPDHIGNVEMFPQSMLLVQKAEYDWPGANNTPRFNPEHPVKKLDGDYDVFGDGSVTILSTPGHTPGHQSLLVKLPKTGAVLLSGDAVHFKDNFDKRRVPAGNTSKEQTLASMQRLADVMKKEHAQLWINHDKAQSDKLKHAPASYN